MAARGGEGGATEGAEGRGGEGRGGEGRGGEGGGSDGSVKRTRRWEELLAAPIWEGRVWDGLLDLVEYWATTEGGSLSSRTRG